MKYVPASVIALLAVLTLLVIAAAASFGWQQGARAQTETVIEVGDFWFCEPKDSDCMSTHPDDIDVAIEINVGDTVKWQWVGTGLYPASHTTTHCADNFTTCGGPREWDSANLSQTSGTFSFTFSSPGTFLFRCQVHPTHMRGEITVVDAEPPTVTIDQASGQADPTDTSPINFTVVFSEDVSGFTDGDVTLSGTAGATTTNVTGGPAIYNVAVSGMTSDGTVIATIPAGNSNAASTSSDNTVTFDTSLAASLTPSPTPTPASSPTPPVLKESVEPTPTPAAVPAGGGPPPGGSGAPTSWWLALVAGGGLLLSGATALAVLRARRA